MEFNSSEEFPFAQPASAPGSGPTPNLAPGLSPSAQQHKAERPQAAPPQAANGKDLSMTARIIAAEANNTNRIVFYKFGAYWRAYEHSAWLFIQDIADFTPNKDFVISAGNQEVVFVGTREPVLDSRMKGVNLLEEEKNASGISVRRIYAAPHSTLDIQAFELWKEKVPISSKKRSAAVAAKKAPEPEMLHESISFQESSNVHERALEKLWEAVVIFNLEEASSHDLFRFAHELKEIVRGKV